MNESAIQILAKTSKGIKNAAWVFDEAVTSSEFMHLPQQQQILSDRFDHLSLAQSHHLDLKLCSYEDLANQLPNECRDFFIRVSKSRSLTRHWINCLSEALPIGGRLHIAGGKKEGTRNYIDGARKLLNDNSAHIHHKNILQASLTKQKHITSTLVDKNFTELVNVTDGELNFQTRPGIFGWNKIDKGSRLLVDTVRSNALIQDNNNVLDLGCGYGYLSIALAQVVDASFTATDNHLTALSVCQSNFDNLGIRGVTLADNCGDSINKKYDLVVCNPPFHTGFSVDDSLLSRFLHTASVCLEISGEAVFVVNSFIDLPQIAQQYFSDCERLIAADGFSVYQLQQS